MSKKLFNYWNALRAGRPAPERSEIEPSDIRDILGDTFILEVSQRMRTISFRLAGTRLCAAYGRELKGLGFLALWQEDDNFEIAQAVMHVYRNQVPVMLSYTGATEAQRFVEFEAILLPLMPAADGNARILGVAAPRKTPYWLGAEPIVSNHLRTARPIEIRRETADETPSLMPADGLPIGEEDIASQRRVAHLTVIEGGRD
ncbi:MAG: PAS domain-containing protein [Salaquimonas sp.]|nr:PAS domain-containing protein [Salaquimonas sp.]